MNVLEVLENDHEITLFTLSDVDFDRLNEYFGTTANGVPVRRFDGPGDALRRSHRWTQAVSPRGLGRLHACLFARLVRTVDDDYDLVVSTFGEFDFDCPSIQYIHYPMFGRHLIPADIERRGTARVVYDYLCDAVAGQLFRHTTSGTLLANSDWTARITEGIYGRRPRTLYPPVDTREFDPVPWSERADGIVAIGRVDPSKRVETLIDITEGLWQRGHDLPLYIVGPIGEGRYSREIRRRAETTAGVHLVGAVSRQELIKYVCSYRYGLHGMRYEHFGIAVAELVAGGALPFIHDSGGQCEIVDESALRYRSVDDAIRKIEAVHTNSDKQRDIIENLPDIESRFGRSRFKRVFRRTVETVLDSASQ